MQCRPSANDNCLRSKNRTGALAPMHNMNGATRSVCYSKGVSYLLRRERKWKKKILTMLIS